MSIAVFDALARAHGIKEGELYLVRLSESEGPDGKHVVKFREGYGAHVTLQEHSFGGTVTSPEGVGADPREAVENLVQQARGKVISVRWMDDEQVVIPVPSDFLPPVEQRTYMDLAGALQDCAGVDKESILIRHRLQSGGEIEEHYHPYAAEKVLLGQGKVEVSFEGRREVIELEDDGGAVRVLNFPPNRRHALRALSDLDYFVIRDREDETIKVKS